MEKSDSSKPVSRVIDFHPLLWICRNRLMHRIVQKLAKAKKTLLISEEKLADKAGDFLVSDHTSTSGATQPKILHIKHVILIQLLGGMSGHIKEKELLQDPYSDHRRWGQWHWSAISSPQAARFFNSKELMVTSSRFWKRQSQERNYGIIIETILLSTADI